jgi:pseudouridine kinase
MMTARSSCLLLGAASLDLIGRLEGELQPGTSNPAHIRAAYGGVARNVAENLARLGEQAILMTAVGADRIGEEILNHTAQAGVDVSVSIRSEAFPSGFYLAALDPRGALAFALDDMRVMTSLTPTVIREHQALFRSVSLVFVDANLSPQALKTVFALARKAGVPVCADPTSVSLAERLREHLQDLFLITPNSAEAAVLTGQPFDPSDVNAATAAARRLVALGVQTAIITLAEFGVCYATSETTGHIPALRTKIVDPTGAGDALTAAVLFGLLNEIPLDDALRLGVSAASLTLRAEGTVDPHLSLERLYDQLLI